MSVTNCALTHMFEHEMNNVGMLIETILVNNDSELMSCFVSRHTVLLEQINSKLEQLKNPTHIHDLTVIKEKLVKLQDTLPFIDTAIKNTPTLQNGMLPYYLEDHITETAKHVEDMTLKSIYNWYHDILDHLVWVILHPYKLKHCMECLSRLIKGIELYTTLQGILSDQKDDLLICWRNTKRLYAFLFTFSSTIQQGVLGKRSPTRRRKYK